MGTGRKWLAALAMVAGASRGAAQTPPSISFDAPRMYPVPGVATDIAIGDFNGDGRPDIVTVSRYLSVLLNQGKQGFGPPITNPFSIKDFDPKIVTADFNGDGKLDVAVLKGDGAHIFLGNGDGSFQSPRTAFAGGTVKSMVVGDFNGDGKLDLVFAQDGFASISVLLGRGDGTFGFAAIYPANTHPESLVAGDFNGDGNLDLVVAGQDSHLGIGNLSILLGTGTGAFAAPKTVARGGYFDVVAADFNGDGKLDVAALSYSPQGHVDTKVLLGNGDSTFNQARAYIGGVLTDYYTAALIIGDLNGDGKPDLILNTGQILLGRGDGSFRRGPQQWEPKGGRIAAVDFNGDGKLDLATNVPGGVQGTLVAVLDGLGDGTFRQAAVWATEGTPLRAAVGDFNGDGHSDLAITAESDVEILLGNGHGGFQSPAKYVAGDYPTGVATSDLNGDGRLDLVVTNVDNGGSAAGVSILLGNGDGTFQSPVSYSMASSPQFVTIADLNRDGIPDLIVVSASSSYTLYILLGKGDGTFQSPVSYLDGQVTSAAVADFNGDGVPDLAIGVCVSNSGGVAVMLGIGDGTFQLPAIYSIPTCPGAVATGDLRGDGISDVVASGGSDPYNQTYTLLGNGDGSLRPALVADFFAASLALADFNGDGKLDLGFIGGFAGVALGNGDGTFQTPTYFYTSIYPYDGGFALAGDFNGNGKPDLAIPDAGALAILKNTTK